MRLKLAAVFTLVTAPALAHPEHGFQLPDLLHLLTEPDHITIVAGVFVLAAVGLFAFRRSRK